MNFINKYQDKAAYDAAEKDYPNVSLVDGELVYVAEIVPVKFTDTEIEWLFTDGKTTKAMADYYPTIDTKAAQALIDALNDPKAYTVFATGWYKYSDGGKINIDLKDAKVTFSKVTTDQADLEIVDGAETYTLGSISEGAISVGSSSYPSATWGVTYEITSF